MFKKEWETKKKKQWVEQTFGNPSQWQLLFGLLCLCQMFAFLKLKVAQHASSGKRCRLLYMRL